MAGFDPSGITEALGVVQAGYGIVKDIQNNKKIKNLLAQRKSYTTPDEVFKILNATLNKSQGDTLTRDFQTNQLDTSFGDALGTAETLGADPNQLSSLFGQKIQGMLQIGDQFHKSNMESFGNYMNALKLVGDNKTAEWQSQQDIIKDQLQAAGQQKQDNTKNIAGGINTFLSGLSADATMDLYKEMLANKPAASAKVSGSFGTGTLGREYRS